MARKTREEQQLEDLQRYADEAYLQRTDVQRALKAQGVNVPGTPRSDAANPLTGDENGLASTDTNGITAVSAVDATGLPQDDDLDALTRATMELQGATADRRAADRLKAQHPNTDQAQQQSTADQIQASLGRAQRVSNLAQSGIRDRVLSTADRLGAWRTPGGILALLLILWLLLFILVEVNGQPRGVWLWLVLLRKAHLMPESKAAQFGQQSGTTGAATGIAGAAATGAAETAVLSQQAVAAYTQVPSGGSNITPINIGALSLSGGVTNALNRYINP